MFLEIDATLSTTDYEGSTHPNQFTPVFSGRRTQIFLCKQE
uniref:Uncharacterized protein n=1 Tax=Utricularia reniformis TaxID=192314 RepID=A0A1Y0B3Q9_9LAMI|nr:hypothetical protein AEK19_MT0861 [Utricularia reniformis]YP_009382274.1 hypothetical protein AEK19_MT1848 [Utricularia reniformis]ART31094.1 hypothetical protein AEK19_MT0861 [Utricularia reniformis]ART32017.1 hypothetical protein AEK19_MT1848 [Utricularia reniformis]